MSYFSTPTTGNVTLGAVGAGSTTYTVLAAGGAGASPVWTTSAATGLGYNSSITANGSLVLNGDDADVKINGVSLKDTLSTIEERLAILRPNTMLEKEFDELKELGDAYRAAEKRLTEQKRVFDILKKTD